MRAHRTKLPLLCVGILALAIGSGVGCSDGDRCGPSSATVTRVIDGDTIELSSGETVRLLMIDTPEITGGANECFGLEARQHLVDTILDQQVSLGYDERCEDDYGRLLAYVSLNGVDINARMVERGYACVLHIPPNGADRVDSYEALQGQAAAEERGMWLACTEVTCE